MNFAFVLGLIKGRNMYETISKVLTPLAGFVAGADSNKTGTDELTAGVLASVAKGIDAYAVQDNNEHGSVVDGVIAALEEYRAQAKDIGLII